MAKALSERDVLACQAGGCSAWRVGSLLPTGLSLYPRHHRAGCPGQPRDVSGSRGLSPVRPKSRFRGPIPHGRGHLPLGVRFSRLGWFFSTDMGSAFGRPAPGPCSPGRSPTRSASESGLWVNGSATSRRPTCWLTFTRVRLCGLSWPWSPSFSRSSTSRCRPRASGTSYQSLRGTGFPSRWARCSS